MFSVLSVFWLPQPGIYEGVVERRNEGYAVDFESSSKSATISSATQTREQWRRAALSSAWSRKTKAVCPSTADKQMLLWRCFTFCCTEFVWPGFTVNVIPYFYSGLYALPFHKLCSFWLQAQISTDTLLVQNTQTTGSFWCVLGELPTPEHALALSTKNENQSVLSVVQNTREWIPSKSIR